MIMICTIVVLLLSFQKYDVFLVRNAHNSTGNDITWIVFDSISGILCLVYLWVR